VATAPVITKLEAAKSSSSSGGRDVSALVGCAKPLTIDHSQIYPVSMSMHSRPSLTVGPPGASLSTTPRHPPHNNNTTNNNLRHNWPNYFILHTDLNTRLPTNLPPPSIFAAETQALLERVYSAGTNLLNSLPTSVISTFASQRMQHQHERGGRATLHCPTHPC
jgi:hypothetical protein